MYPTRLIIEQMLQDGDHLPLIEIKKSPNLYEIPADKQDVTQTTEDIGKDQING